MDTDSLRRNKWIRMVSRFITLEGLLVAVGIVLTGGLINYLLEGSSIPATVLITRSLQTQSILETLTYIIDSTMGFLGVYMIMRSSQPSKAGRESFLVFITGFLLLMLAFFLFFSLYSFKLNG